MHCLILFLSRVFATITVEVSLGSIVSKFNESPLGVNVPFPPALLRSFYLASSRKLRDTRVPQQISDDLRVSINKNEKGRIVSVTPIIVEGEFRSMFCQQVLTLANIDEKSPKEGHYFYAPLMEACAKGESLETVIGGKLKPISAREEALLWEWVLRITEIIDKEPACRDQAHIEKCSVKAFEFKDLCMDYDFERLLSLLEEEVSCKYDKELGRGAYGVVYRGKCDGIGDVATKQMSIYGSRHKYMVEEIEAMQAMSDSPHFPKFYRASLHNFYTIHLHMELLEGIDGVRLYKLPLDNSIVAAIIKQMLEGLQFLHEKGYFTHNDIKYDNIFLTKEGRLKILDLGMATRPDQEFTPDHWKPGVVGYAPPELYYPYLGYTTASDVWCVGTLTLAIAIGHTMKLPKVEKQVVSVGDVVAGQVEEALLKCNQPKNNNLKELLSQILQLQMESRPNIRTLLEHSFFKEAASDAQLKQWITKVLTVKKSTKKIPTLPQPTLHNKNKA